LAVKLVKVSPWVDAVKGGFSLVLLGLAFRQPFDTALVTQLPKGLDRAIGPSLTIILFIICILVAVDLIKAVVRIGRKRLAN
jgi:hypothetical protein